MRKSKKRFGLISYMLLLLLAFVSPALVAAENLDWDDTTVHGDYLGKNEVREFNTSYVYVIGKKLFMHETSDLSSAPIQVLEEGDFVEFLESQHGVLYVRDAVGSSNGDITYRQSKEKEETRMKGHVHQAHTAPNAEAANGHGSKDTYGSAAGFTNCRESAS